MCVLQLKEAIALAQDVTEVFGEVSDRQVVLFVPQLPQVICSLLLVGTIELASVRLKQSNEGTGLRADNLRLHPERHDGLFRLYLDKWSLPARRPTLTPSSIPCSISIAIQHVCLREHGLHKYLISINIYDFWLYDMVVTGNMTNILLAVAVSL